MSEETQVQDQDSKKLKFSIYKTKASLHLDNWLQFGKVMLKLAPAIEGKKSGQPEKGSNQYDYEKAINIGFSYQDLLKASYRLLAMSYGDETTYTKFADLSKVEGKDLKGNKKLTISPSSYKGKNGEVKIISINLSLDDKNISIALDYDEAYALAKHFELIYSFALSNTLIGEMNGAK